MDYRYGNHTVYSIDYHFVWVTKYRYHLLVGDVGHRVRDLVRQTCEAFEIRIKKGVSVKIMCTFLCLHHQLWHQVRSCIVSKGGHQASCSKSFPP